MFGPLCVYIDKGWTTCNVISSLCVCKGTDLWASNHTYNESYLKDILVCFKMFITLHCLNISGIPCYCTNNETQKQNSKSVLTWKRTQALLIVNFFLAQTCYIFWERTDSLNNNNPSPHHLLGAATVYQYFRPAGIPPSLFSALLLHHFLFQSQLLSLNPQYLSLLSSAASAGICMSIKLKKHHK